MRRRRQRFLAELDIFVGGLLGFAALLYLIWFLGLPLMGLR